MASGDVPVVYDRAVPVVQSTMVCAPPYHGTRLRCQRVVGWQGDLFEIGQACPHHLWAARSLLTNRMRRFK